MRSSLMLGGLWIVLVLHRPKQAAWAAVRNLLQWIRRNLIKQCSFTIKELNTEVGSGGKFHGSEYARLTNECFNENSIVEMLP